MQLSLRAVGEEMNGVVAAALPCPGRHLRQTAGTVLEQEHRDTRTDARYQNLVVGYRSIDEGCLLAAAVRSGIDRTQLQRSGQVCRAWSSESRAFASCSGASRNTF
ncbi:hypothetical protein SAE02_76780 [Skermanella aerolata]|uniref:Uncharacterized protein n=1 Tax=Skermanella aerolata TaxID=393310 RepID=A0A512E4W8_9PROT|nr:hypothetical protein N826_07390 [Skermanella aerolata KACC 11604]GEO43530.1 hypothetical protein SAE02_76780 [Skermanella aerolata]